jgi:VanZ family protein
MISRPGLRWPSFWWVCDWLIVLVVVFASLMPPDQLHRSMTFHDKLMHAGAYFFMTIWFAGSLDPKKYRWLILGMVLLGIFIECAQYLMPYGRSADWRDLVANIAGMSAALILARMGFSNWMAWIERRFA